MPKNPTSIIPPARLPKVFFVTEAQLAHLVRVTPETLRAWRRRGEMPPIAVGPEVDKFVEGLKRRGPKAVCYRISDVSAWLFGTGGPGGRPKEPPASAFDPANDRTASLRLAAEATSDPKEKKRLLRQLTGQAKFVTRLGFSNPTAYEDWLARGAPEDELPPDVRAALDPDAPLAGEQDSELRSDAAIGGVEPRVVTAERPFRAEPQQPKPPRLPILDDDIDPFASNVVTRRGPRGYFGG